MNFIVYDKYTGKIKRTGFCNEEDFNRQAIEQNELVLEGIADDSFDIVDTKNKKIIKGHKIVNDVNIKDNINILILDKMTSILRRMAIKELKREGKLSEDYNEV